MIFSTGKKEYNFESASFSEVIRDVKDISERNHYEMNIYNDLPPNADFERFSALEAQGDLAFMTITYENVVVGYSIFFLDHEIIQKDIKSATQSMVYIDKEHRGMGVGYAFIEFCDDILKKQGINSVWRQASAKFDAGPVYEKLGYKFVEKAYLRRF